MAVNSIPKREGFDALVTQGWGRIAYNIVRSLGKRGLKVALGTDEFLGMAVLSRYPAATFRHPSYIRRASEFIASLKESLQEFAPKVYIPSEQQVLIVAKYRNQLGDLRTKIPIAPFATLRLLHKKDGLTRLASSLGIPTPETLVPHNLGEVLNFSREYGDPVVLKRLSSSGGRGVLLVNRDSIVSGERACSIHGMQFGEFLVQRCVQGTGYGVSMLFNRGELRAKFTHKRLRERRDSGGISTLRMSVSNPLLEEYAEGLLRRAGFHGVAMVEFKYDEERNQAWVLEVNPRFWGSLALAIHSGVDFPYLLYKMALEGDVEPVLDYRKNVQARWILGDVFSMLGQLGRNGHHRSGSAQTPAARVFDDLNWRDPLPFAGQFAFSAWKYLKTLHSSPEETDISPDHL